MLDNTWKNMDDAIFNSMHMPAKDFMIRVLNQVDAIVVSIKLKKFFWFLFCHCSRKSSSSLDPPEVGAFKLNCDAFATNIGCCLHPAYGLVKSMHELIKDDDHITWFHALREANQIADCLANFANSLDSQLRIFYFLADVTREVYSCFVDCSPFIH